MNGIIYDSYISKKIRGDLEDSNPKLIVSFGNLRLVGYAMIENERLVKNKFNIIAQPYAVGILDETEQEIIKQYEKDQKVTLPTGTYRTELINNQRTVKQIKTESLPRNGDSFWSEP